MVNMALFYPNILRIITIHEPGIVSQRLKSSPFLMGGRKPLRPYCVGIFPKKPGKNWPKIYKVGTSNQSVPVAWPLNKWTTQAGWWFGTCCIFPFSWECHHPNWRTPSFFRGVGTPTRNIPYTYIPLRTIKSPLNTMKIPFKIHISG